MAILQSVNYNKFDNFERFSNAADEISTKLLSSVLKCHVLVAVPDRCDFEFLTKAAVVTIMFNYDIECLPKGIWAEIIYHQL